MDMKNLIIGLDGATWEIIDYFIDENVMPNFGRLKETACHAKLKSTILPITPSAWASMMTGCRPPKTGIYHFLKSSGKQNSYARELVNSSDIRVPTMWKILSGYGRKVISVNVPMTFPLKPLNGFMISGFMTPENEKNIMYPAELFSEIEEQGIRYRIDMYPEEKRKNLCRGSDDGEAFMNDLNDLLRMRRKTIRYLIGTKEWNYFMFVLVGMDRIQHHFWKYIKNSKLNPKLTESIRQYYREIDEFIGELHRMNRESGNLFIVSDHGFSSFQGNFLINSWLLKNKYLKLQDSNINNSKKFIKKYAEKYHIDLKKIIRVFFGAKKVQQLSLSASNIDWGRTTAFGSCLNGVNVNLKGRETLGCVEPAEYNAIRDGLICDLMKVTNDNGVKIVKRVLRREDVYNEGDMDHIPDLILEFHDDLLYESFPIENITMDTKLFQVCNNLNGSHIRDGVFLAAGKDIRSGIVEEMSIEDVLPTLLALNNEDIPDHIDGKIIKEIANREMTNNYVKLDHDNNSPGYKYSEEGEEDLKEKLKSLGYMMIALTIVSYIRICIQI